MLPKLAISFLLRQSKHQSLKALIGLQSFEYFSLNVCRDNLNDTTSSRLSGSMDTFICLQKLLGAIDRPIPDNSASSRECKAVSHCSRVGHNNTGTLSLLEPFEDIVPLPRAHRPVDTGD